jgi:hypothetical protein
MENPTQTHVWRGLARSRGVCITCHRIAQPQPHRRISLITAIDGKASYEEYNDGRNGLTLLPGNAIGIGPCREGLRCSHRPCAASISSATQLNSTRTSTTILRRREKYLDSTENPTRPLTLKNRNRQRSNRLPPKQPH